MRQRQPDLHRLHTKAERARQKGRVRRAVRLYQEILAQQPEDANVHRKLAPLLARRGRSDEAWESYQAACRGLIERGFDAKAAGLLREATQALPRSIAPWKRLAELEETRGRSADARNALVEGRRRLRGARRRDDAIELLSRAHRLSADDPEVGLDLARLLRQAGRKAPAQRILHHLAERVPGQQRIIRRALFRTAPSPGAFWAWITAPRPVSGLPTRS